MANEKRLIDANKAKAVLVNMAEHLQESGNQEMAGAVGYAAEVIGKQLAVDAVEVVHGRWEDEHGGKCANPRYRCSVCKERALYKFERDFLATWKEVQALTPNCPNCGAKMDGGKYDA